MLALQRELGFAIMIECHLFPVFAVVTLLALIAKGSLMGVAQYMATDTCRGCFPVARLFVAVRTLGFRVLVFKRELRFRVIVFYF